VHKCLGMHFAQQQAKTVMAHLLLTSELQRSASEIRWYGWPSCRPRGKLLLSVGRRSRGS
jgi:cytochrome P450